MILCIIPIIFSSNFWIDLCGVYVHYPRIYLANPLFEHFSRIKIRYSLKGTIRFIFNVFFQNLNRIYSSIQNFPFLIPDKGYTEFNLQSKINITLYYPVFYSLPSNPDHAIVTLTQSDPGNPKKLSPYTQYSSAKFACQKHGQRSRNKVVVVGGGRRLFSYISIKSLTSKSHSSYTQRGNLLLEMKALCTYSLPNQREAEGKTDTERLILLSRAFSLMAFIEVTRAKGAELERILLSERVRKKIKKLGTSTCF